MAKTRTSSPRSAGKRPKAGKAKRSANHATAAVQATTDWFGLGLNQAALGGGGRHFVIHGADMVKNADVTVYDSFGAVAFQGRVISLLGSGGTLALARVTPAVPLGPAGPALSSFGTDDLTVTVTNPGAPESVPTDPSNTDLYTE